MAILPLKSTLSLLATLGLFAGRSCAALGFSCATLGRSGHTLGTPVPALHIRNYFTPALLGPETRRVKTWWAFELFAGHGKIVRAAHHTAEALRGLEALRY